MLVTLSCLALLAVVQVQSGLLPEPVERSIVGGTEWTTTSNEREWDTRIVKDAREALRYWHWHSNNGHKRGKERREMWRSYFRRSMKEGAHVAWYDASYSTEKGSKDLMCVTANPKSRRRARQCPVFGMWRIGATGAALKYDQFASRHTRGRRTCRRRPLPRCASSVVIIIRNLGWFIPK